MNEGRRTQIVLLDDRRLDIVVQPRLHVSELLNIVASHCQLKDPDKQYFGFIFSDDKQQYHWLQNDRKVLDHEYPRKFTSIDGTLMLKHAVKFYVESITQLAHPASIELLFLQVISKMQTGLIQADHQTIVQISAYAMQAYFGDFTNANIAQGQLKRLSILQSTLKSDQFNTEDCERRILEIYEKLRGISRGTAIVNCMTSVERLQTYGMHMYEVKDKNNGALILGISSRGIYQYDPCNMEKPKKGFHWKQLENLYYKERKFSVEVHDPKSTMLASDSLDACEDPYSEDQFIDDSVLGSPIARRAFMTNNTYVHIFWCDSAQLCKTIWSLSIAQHQFYLDRRAAAKQKGARFIYHTPRELVSKLDDGMSIFGNASRPASPLKRDCTNGLVNSIPRFTIPRSNGSIDHSDNPRKESITEIHDKLRIRKMVLEEILMQKIKELKEICVKEGELTGEMPAEIQRVLIPGEKEPKIKRRVGTAFAITTETMSKHTKLDQLAKLEASIDIHKKIVAAALKLASESTANKSIRRKRKRDYDAARLRLKELEQRLHETRISSSKPDLSSHLNGTSSTTTLDAGGFRICKSLPTTPGGSMSDLTFDQMGISYSPEPARQNQPLQHSISFPAGSSKSNANGGSIQKKSNNGSAACGTAESLIRHNQANGYRSRSNYNQSATRNAIRCGFFSSFTNSGRVLRTTSERDAASIQFRCGSNIGAYNIPNRRTSWDREILRQPSTETMPIVPGSSESLNIGLRTLPTIASNSNGCYTGSLDRRQLKQKQRGNKSSPMLCSRERNGYFHSPTSSPTRIQCLDRSPTRYGRTSTYLGLHHLDSASAISPRLVRRLLSTNSSIHESPKYELLASLRSNHYSDPQKRNASQSTSNSDLIWNNDRKGTSNRKMATIV